VQQRIHHIDLPTGWRALTIRQACSDERDYMPGRSMVATRLLPRPARVQKQLCCVGPSIGAFNDCSDAWRSRAWHLVSSCRLGV
jgi:hypothetical protein